MEVLFSNQRLFVGNRQFLSSPPSLPFARLLLLQAHPLALESNVHRLIWPLLTIPSGHFACESPLCRCLVCPPFRVTPEDSRLSTR